MGCKIIRLKPTAIRTLKFPVLSDHFIHASKVYSFSTYTTVRYNETPIALGKGAFPLLPGLHYLEHPALIARQVGYKSDK